MLKPMNDSCILPEPERLALREEILEIQARMQANAPDDRSAGAHAKIASYLGRGISQQVIHLLISRGAIGPVVARRIYSALGTTRSDLLLKHAAKIAPRLDPADLVEIVAPSVTSLQQAIELVVEDGAATPAEARTAATYVAHEAEHGWSRLDYARALERRIRDQRRSKSLGEPAALGAIIGAERGASAQYPAWALVAVQRALHSGVPNTTISLVLESIGRGRLTSDDLFERIRAAEQDVPRPRPSAPPSHDSRRKRG